MLHKRALRESPTDRVLCKGATIRCNSMCVLCQYASGQRNIVGDDHVSSNDLLCDPIVGDIRSRGRDYKGITFCRERARTLNKPPDAG